MKKKIILLLCCMMLATILTGCSTITIDEAEIVKMTEIADHVANEKEYKLPEGYMVSYKDGTTNERICIENKNNQISLKATFDVSGEDTKLIQICVFDYSMMYSVWTYIIIMLAFLGFILLLVLIERFFEKINKKLEKANSKLKKIIAELKKKE